MKNKICGKKVVLYGCGQFAKRIFYPLMKEYQCDIVACADGNQNLWEMKFEGKKIISPEKLKNLEFDYVIIAAEANNAIDEIKKRLLELMIPEDKIVNVISDWNYLDLFINQRTYWIRDYARYVKENNIFGEVAECGVFRGNSAKFINAYFDSKKLYLFDTFEGFNENDLKVELSFGNVKFNEGVFAQNPFKQAITQKDLMNKMKYPQNVIIKKGYFPESAEGVEERFCFVNLDMDLYAPMLSGMEFFWDKMVEGG